MSNKESSDKSGNDKKSLVVDTEEPVVLVDETGARDKDAPEAATADNADDPSAEVKAQADAESAVVDESATEGSDSQDSPGDSGAETAGQADAAETAGEDGEKLEHEPAEPPLKAPARRRSWFGLFNFLLILALAGAAGYYWWLEQQMLQEYHATIADLEARLQSKAELSSLDRNLAPLRSGIGAVERRIGELETGQQSLRESSEKLYELFGRDRADWQLAEVEYLMRVAQHKLILEHDFAGAALTLEAASERLGLTGDPGMLPVRVTISEEIAELKTRERPDLVGMTLTLARLARQARMLEPGFAPRTVDTIPAVPEAEPSGDWLERAMDFIDSLVEVRHEDVAPSTIEAEVADVGETLEDNLKLARWAVLDRDARQYADLIDSSLRLLREFYDLDNAVNNEFLRELQALEKMQLAPQKPDISRSLLQLRQIMSQRENAPTAAEPGNG